jgi:probable HAF family extracellular repeat protein
MPRRQSALLLLLAAACTDASVSRPLAPAEAALGIGPLPPWITYVLPDVPGYTEHAAVAVNDNHVVVGTAEPANGNDEVATWTNSVVTLVGKPLGYTWAQPTDINNSGTIVGYGLTAGGTTRAIQYKPATGWTILSDLGYGGRAHGLNDAGDVVGMVLNNIGQMLPVRWTAGGTRYNLARPTFSFGVAYEVNGSGRIIGELSWPGGGSPYYWTTINDYVAINTGMTSVQARDINASNVIAFVGTNNGVRSTWQSASPYAALTPMWADFRWPALSDKNRGAGTQDDPVTSQQKAVTWRSGTLTTLSASGALGTYATSVNAC